MKIKILIFFTLLVIGSVFFFIVKSGTSDTKLRTPISNNSKVLPAKEKQTANLKDYQNPSGFKFSYPQELDLTPQEKLKDNYYASIRLTSKTYPGEIYLEITDSEYYSLFDWLENNKNLIKNTKESKLADLEAIQFEDEVSFTTLAVDSQTLITIISKYTTPSKNYWKNIHQTIVSTFDFSFPQDSKNTNQEVPADSSEDSIFFEGEEIIE